ncbi:hypothetical protein [Burkholderia sp. Ac-20353]|uniref:hypothetical protein n=1 Tax=Burkholderia sp. Ac-20353 TaxID=2703894 RepID=UPI001F11A3F4|nr:hypothetical protein [Burkholderia sp. Ac-20353]
MTPLGDGQKRSQQFQFHSGQESYRSKHSFYGSNAERFNTVMFIPEPSVMPFRHPMNPARCVALEPAVDRAPAGDSEPDPAAAAAPAPRNARRRPRFADAISDTERRATTGSIAISFAVVSRRHWPR